VKRKEAGVALVDIGGGTTDITIFQDGIIRHTAVIPFGGNVITRDIKDGCTVMTQQAEKLKVRFGSAIGRRGLRQQDYHHSRSERDALTRRFLRKNLARIIQARVEEILDYVIWEIRRSGFERSSDRRDRLDRRRCSA
jgi:cell division protein FtsA